MKPSLLTKTGIAGSQAGAPVPMDIRPLIYEIRGRQVMLDRDLAAIYQVLTKRLNEQVRRNIERFPDEFMFQLTKDEMNELVANCDRFKMMKHSSVATLDMLAKRGLGVKVELVTHSSGEIAESDFEAFAIRKAHDYVDFWKVGKLNHSQAVEQSALGSKFRDDATALLEHYGCKYYIKEDLRKAS